MPCERDHSGETTLEITELDSSQAGEGRHKCAGCAYELGRVHGMAHILEELAARLGPEAVEEIQVAVEKLKSES